MARHEVVSPIPGIFYRRPDPRQRPVRRPGASRRGDDTIGLIEVMKCFHPVPAGGRHRVEFLVEYEDVVDAGQPRRGDRGRRVKRLLVANRGEIAVRIVRAARDLGITRSPCTAPRTPTRRTSGWPTRRRHRPAAGGKSYLRDRRDFARGGGDGADAVHPGYGFLSERAAFAAAVSTPA